MRLRAARVAALALAAGCRMVNPAFDDDVRVGTSTSTSTSPPISSDGSDPTGLITTGTPSDCIEGEVACAGSCIDPLRNVLHCGGCDQPCPMTQVCVDGQCVLSCAPGEIVCGSNCVDPLRDPLHCGTCDNPCGELYCVDGSCVVECPADRPTPCAGTCVDTDTDDGHCGACNAPCDANENCAAGACEPGCPTAELLCDDACIDPLNDEKPLR